MNSIIVFGLFFIFFIYGASAKVQQIASVPLPVHQSVSQAFSWGSEFYVATRTIGITIPYSGSCNLYRFTSGGLLTGTLNLLNITVASYSDDMQLRFLFSVNRDTSAEFLPLQSPCRHRPSFLAHPRLGETLPRLLPCPHPLSSSVRLSLCL